MKIAAVDIGTNAIKSKISAEEEKFSATFFRGMEILSHQIKLTDYKVLSGSTAFLLYDTYGFPIDLTVDICKEKKMNNGTVMDINAPVVKISQFSPLDPNNSFNLAVKMISLGCLSKKTNPTNKSFHTHKN